MASGRILFIDSDASSRSYVAAILGQRGFAVELAASGGDGLLAARREPPDVILADPAEIDLPGEQLAAKLRSDPLTAKIPLVAFSSDPDPARAESCMRAGFSEFLVKSADVMPALLETLSGYLSQTSRLSRPGGLSVAFLSAKGGTGTSSLCANLAMNMAEYRSDARFVVADLVLPLGSIAGIVGYQGRENLVTMAARRDSELTPESLRQNLPQTGNWRFQLLSGPPDPESANELDVRRIEDLVIRLRSAFDFVIIDLGRSLSRISLPLIEQADLIVMIVGTDLSSVTLSKNIWDYLRSKGVHPSSVYTIQNRAVGLQGTTKSEAEKIIGLPIRTAVPYLAENFALANNQHVPFCVKYPSDTASIILREAAREMVHVATRTAVAA